MTSSEAGEQHKLMCSKFLDTMQKIKQKMTKKKTTPQHREKKKKKKKNHPIMVSKGGESETWCSPFITHPLLYDAETLVWCFPNQSKYKNCQVLLKKQEDSPQNRSGAKISHPFYFPLP